MLNKVDVEAYVSECMEMDEMLTKCLRRLRSLRGEYRKPVYRPDGVLMPLDAGEINDNLSKVLDALHHIYYVMHRQEYKHGPHDQVLL